MGSTADKISGVTNETVGKAKQGIGKAAGRQASDRRRSPRGQKRRAEDRW
jgi:uncharacterized protein YjbJ (UPF0337 family)